MIAMNIEKARFNMIWQQIRPWDVLDPSVLDLLSIVKREAFVPPAYKALAFSDVELPLGQGQVMFSPKLEARILQELAIKPGERALEIGTGSGYMAALLAGKAEHVLSVEIRPELAEFARANLARAGIHHVDVETADGAAKVFTRGPFDVIVISGGICAVPDRLLKKLRPGGRLFAIVGTAPAMQAQLVSCTHAGVYRAVPLFETVAPALERFTAASDFDF
jgi:protein-L-isoaspartate(D-aspartate) O-methyltransferase